MHFSATENQSSYNHLTYRDTPAPQQLHTYTTQAMAQPDLARLANAFTVISNEVTLLSNIPAVQQGQNLLGVINEMRDEMRDEMRQFRTEVTAVRTEVKALRNEVRTEVTALRTEVRAFRTELEDFRTEITERLDAE